MSSSLGSSSLYTSAVQPDPSRPFHLPMQRSCSTLAYKFSTLLLPASYLLFLHPPRPLMYLAFLLLSLHPLFHSGFFNGMLEVFVPEALDFSTLSHFILWILSVSRNPTLTHLPLSGSLDILLCDLIALTPGLAFFLPMTCTSVVVSSFSSG